MQKGGAVQESFVNHALGILNGRMTCRKDHAATTHVQVDKENVSFVDNMSESRACRECAVCVLSRRAKQRRSLINMKRRAWITYFPRTVASLVAPKKHPWG